MRWPRTRHLSIQSLRPGLTPSLLRIDNLTSVAEHLPNEHGGAGAMAKIDTTVGKLVDMIKDGDLRLPEMQRRYVWPATRVRDLLDSLYRGYPSGTILVWETDREMPSRDLDVGQEKGAFGGHRLLLDGQQRFDILVSGRQGSASRCTRPQETHRHSVQSRSSRRTTH